MVHGGEINAIVSAGEEVGAVVELKGGVVGLGVLDHAVGFECRGVAGIGAAQVYGPRRSSFLET